MRSFGDSKIIHTFGFFGVGSAHIKFFAPFFLVNCRRKGLIDI